MLRSKPRDESLTGLLGNNTNTHGRTKSSSSPNRPTRTNTAPKSSSSNKNHNNQKATLKLPTSKDAMDRPSLGSRRTSDKTMLSKTALATTAAVGQKVGQRVKKGVGVAGKGTVKATKIVSKKTTRVAKSVGNKTVGAVSNLNGTAVVKGAVGAIHLAETGIKGINNLAARTLKRNEVVAAAAWKTRVTSPVTKVELVLECKNLRRKDAFAECDAFAVLWKVPNGYGSDGQIGKMGGDESYSSLGMSAGHMSLSSISSANSKRRKRPRVNRLPTSSEKEVGRTEVVRGNRNPHFDKLFVIDFKFQEEQTYVIRIYDRDLDYCEDLKEHDFLGGAVFTMGELMGEGRRELRRPLRSHATGKGDKSFLTIRGNEVSSARSVMEFRFSAIGLRENDKGVIEKEDDPYFQILKLNQEDQSWDAVYKSEVLMRTDAPTWAKARLPLPVLCNDDMANPLRITFWDWRRSEQAEALGFVETTVQELVEGAERGIPVMDIRREHKRLFRRDKIKKKGSLKVLRSELQPVPTMMEYIYGGCKIDLMVAVDCSIHNDDPEVEGGLHHRPGPHWLNDYEAAIHKVGAIMEPYSNDKEFSIWGFGGDIRGEAVSLFPVGDADGTVHGASGLLDAYDTTFTSNPLYMEPADDANIAPVIQSAMYRAIKKSEQEHCYSVLCILTAGNIGDDLRDTIDTICTAAEDAPLSIVIIGVGENEEAFTTIRKVIANGGKLRHSNGVPISRDIVSFASFDDFEGNASNVAAEGLKELPEQFVEYFTDNGIQPRPPVTASSIEKESAAMKDDSRSTMGGSSRRRNGDRSDRRSPRGTRRRTRSRSPKKSGKARGAGS
ncbi:Copine-6 [Seminavis robusta]|uniref:Copine-6 n=1 Tax=Seminavis robusta TaxID=568900 RepID=A0A9N8DY96_9STRA|nr:Copine-6 [Seminavis robusta]|eukprot:Sro337_g120650.1 Copine-6 (836) ;mRNA; r:43341-45848